ncbi:MAG: hypothetical protein M1833_000629 [Piccolia ochrophora]|nr:MAG: hypothetical protein M1833_000629 [Piccolia ochrophora]
MDNTRRYEMIELPKVPVQMEGLQEHLKGSVAAYLRVDLPVILAAKPLEAYMAQKGAFKLPIAYRSFFLLVEPISALAGAFYAYMHPSLYLQLTHSPSAPSSLDVPLSTRIVLTQLSNLYLLFAINEALVLRSTRDLSVWRTVLACLLVADVGHLYSFKDLGLDIYWDLSQWTAMTWGSIGFVYAGAAMRLAFLTGVGLPTTLNTPSAPASKANSA